MLVRVYLLRVRNDLRRHLAVVDRKVGPSLVVIDYL